MAERALLNKPRVLGTLSTNTLRLYLVVETKLLNNPYGLLIPGTVPKILSTYTFFFESERSRLAPYIKLSY
jgi:hypothetical protein